jgi:hypothetical protein
MSKVQSNYGTRSKSKDQEEVEEQINELPSTPIPTCMFIFHYYYLIYS